MRQPQSAPLKLVSRTSVDLSPALSHPTPFTSSCLVLGLWGRPILYLHLRRIPHYSPDAPVQGFPVQRALVVGGLGGDLGDAVHRCALEPGAGGEGQVGGDELSGT